MSEEVRMRLMKEIKGQSSTHDCPDCGGPAYCAMEDGKSASACWCMSVQVNRPMSMGDECLCRTCLTKEE